MMTARFDEPPGAEYLPLQTYREKLARFEAVCKRFCVSEEAIAEYLNASEELLKSARELFGSGPAFAEIKRIASQPAPLLR